VPRTSVVAAVRLTPICLIAAMSMTLSAPAIAADGPSDSNSFTLVELQPGRDDSVNMMSARDVTPGATVVFLYGFATGNTAIPGCEGGWIGIKQPDVLGTARADASGVALFQKFVHKGTAGIEIRFQAFELGTCRVSQTFAFTFVDG
jgi:hypothetical protein